MSLSSLLSDDVFDTVVRFLTGTLKYSNELQAFWMAIQGSLAIRNGINKDNKIPWFHAFVLSVIAGYGGGLLGFIWMGKPSSMLSNDLNIGACIIAYIIVNVLPFDIGYKVCSTLPIVLITTAFAQMFRSTAIARFIRVCYSEFKDTPSQYYPIPVFGPILYGTLLGNMSGFIMKGLHGYVGNGMPWPFQNGLFVGTFYHFYVHDKTGPIGNFLRMNVPASKFTTSLDEETFATCAVSFFMLVMGILQLPAFLGPSFSPFNLAASMLSPSPHPETTTNSIIESSASTSASVPSPPGVPTKSSKKTASRTTKQSSHAISASQMNDGRPTSSIKEEVVENNSNGAQNVVKKKKKNKKKQS